MRGAQRRSACRTRSPPVMAGMQECLVVPASGTHVLHARDLPNPERAPRMAGEALFRLATAAILLPMVSASSSFRYSKKAVNCFAGVLGQLKANGPGVVLQKRWR
jgi:hypothetical protein